MTDASKRITEQTLVPISLVIVILGVAVWVSTIKSDTKANADDIERIEKEQKEYVRTVRRIDERLSRIEGKVGVPPTPGDNDSE